MFKLVLFSKKWVFLFLAVLLCSNILDCPLYAISAPYGVGVLTITNQENPKYFILGAQRTMVLDPTMIFEYDTTPHGLCIGVNPVSRASWLGGTIYVTLDTEHVMADDSLSCSPAHADITSAFNANTYTLTITAPNTVSYGDIQNTLRTLSLSCKRPGTGERKIRIWVETTGAKFSSERGGRIFSSVGRLRSNDTKDLFSFQEAYSDFYYNGGMPRHFGMVPYFASISSQAEMNLLITLGNDRGGNVYGFLGTRSFLFTDLDAARENVRSDYTWESPSYHGNVAPRESAEGWAWVGGPDRGKVYWKGGVANSPGTSVLSRYHFWQPGEPNGNSQSTQFGGPWQATWRWGDWDYNDASFRRYFIEYGGMPEDQNVITVKFIHYNSLRIGNPY